MAGLGAATGVVGGIMDIYTGITNKKAQDKNLAYQKDLQKQIFGREDNAVQRQALDMEAAGLSKTLAAGSGANAGSVITTSAPQLSGISEGVGKISQSPAIALDLKQKREQIENTKQNNALIQAQKAKVNEETEFMKQNNPQKVEAADIANQISRATKRSTITTVAEKLWKIQNERNLINYKTDLTLSQLRNMDAKNIAQYISNEMARYNADWYKQFNIPSDMNLTGNTQTTAILYSILDQMRGAPLTEEEKKSLIGEK